MDPQTGTPLPVTLVRAHTDLARHALAWLLVVIVGLRLTALAPSPARGALALLVGLVGLAGLVLERSRPARLEIDADGVRLHRFVGGWSEPWSACSEPTVTGRGARTAVAFLGSPLPVRSEAARAATAATEGRRRRVLTGRFEDHDAASLAALLDAARSAAVRRGPDVARSGAPRPTRPMPPATASVAAAEAPTCAATSLERDEPLAGTAGERATLLLLQAPGGWGRDALQSVDLPDDVRAAVSDLAERERATVLVIRPVGRVDPVADGTAAWALVHAPSDAEPGGSLRWGRWRTAADLDPALLLPPARRPVALVCTHGTRDVCCAVGGRPVAQALADVPGLETWECSHLGGHRFAPTLAVLPLGVVLGRVPVERAAQAVAAVLAGGLPADLTRGRVGLPAPAQAAEVALRALRTPSTPARGGATASTTTQAPRPPVRLLAVTTTADGGEDGEDVTIVRLEVDGRAGVVHLVREDRAPARLSCADVRTKPSTVWRVRTAAWE